MRARWTISTARSLRGLDALVLAQPRLLQPAELVALDGWIRQWRPGGDLRRSAAGCGRAPLPLGDPRRAPLTSLLDPLLLHWGLRLEPVARGSRRNRPPHAQRDRPCADDGGRVALRAGGKDGRAPLRMAGLWRCVPSARGKVRLVADADLLDERLWLADPRWADRPEAYASDIVPLLTSLGDRSSRYAVPRHTPRRREADDAALISGSALGSTRRALLGRAGRTRVWPVFCGQTPGQRQLCGGQAGRRRGRLPEERHKNKLKRVFSHVFPKFPLFSQIDP
jgi:hypothetical protein